MWAGRDALAALLLALATCLAGCDGYPTDDLVRASPHEMDNAMRVQAMNELGRDAHPSRRWAYALEPGCRLKVSAWQQRRRAPPMAVALSTPVAATAAVRFDPEDDTYRVRLHPDGPTLMDARRFGTASQLLLLVRLVARDCEAGAAPAGRG